MNAAEYKNIEGQRIQQVLGAIGALPAAMLVFGDGPTTVAAGAPLFAAAIVLIVGALMNWNYTDAIFYLDTEHHVVPMDHVEDLATWQIALENAGDRFQYRTYGYGVLSLLCSITGVAGVYSSLRLPIPVDIGFLIVIVLTIIVSIDVVRSGLQRNQLLNESRRLSELA